MLERALTRTLNDRPVGHRIGERHPELDDVGAGLDHRMHQRQRGIRAGVAGSDKWNQGLTALITQRGKNARNSTHIVIPSRAATVCMSLSPRPDRLISSI